jgi:hypothetical protein
LTSGNRKKGMSLLRYKNTCKCNLKAPGMNRLNWEELAQKRQKWKQFVKAPSRLKNTNYNGMLTPGGKAGSRNLCNNAKRVLRSIVFRDREMPTTSFHYIFTLAQNLGVGLSSTKNQIDRHYHRNSVVVWDINNKYDTSDPG